MIQQDLLLQRWLHSHEEDTATDVVYRPASYAFPPSRGRGGFELKANGLCTRIGIAAADGASEQPCTWQAKGEGEQEIVLSSEAGGSVSFRIVSLAKDKLVVRKR